MAQDQYHKQIRQINGTFWNNHTIPATIVLPIAIVIGAIIINVITLVKRIATGATTTSGLFQAHAFSRIALF
mgnify:CR=1 FL=1